MKAQHHLKDAAASVVSANRMAGQVPSFIPLGEAKGGGHAAMHARASLALQAFADHAGRRQSTVAERKRKQRVAEQSEEKNEALLRKFMNRACTALARSRRAHRFR
jgi:hypothetical protein